MSMVFSHVTLGQRVLFASGGAAANVAAEVARLGAARVMVIASESGRDVAAAVMAAVDVALRWDDVVQHVPVEIAAAARAAAAAARVDAVVCVGGGSATGSREGGCVDHRPADSGGADHLCGVGGHERVGA